MDESVKTRMKVLAERYDEEQRRVIRRYFDVVKAANAAKGKRFSDASKLAEMKFWGLYDTKLVIEALEIHMTQYERKGADYTRGIIRNKAEEAALEMIAKAEAEAAKSESDDIVTTKDTKSTKNTTNTTKERNVNGMKNRFANFTSRSVDYEAIEYLGRLELDGALTAEKREELSNDPRYAKYLGNMKKEGV